MANIARNAPCPCGSGKKYKRCHGMEDRPTKASKASFKEPPTFTSLIANYSSEPILKLLGVLQLLSSNHGHEGQFEEMARLALLQRKTPDDRPFASWQRLNATIAPMGYPVDPPTNAFTENAIFREGNYVVYPGIYLGVTEILNQLLECIFLEENDLPKEFKKDVNDGVGLILFMSNNIAQAKGHSRYIYGQPNYEKIAFPDYDTLIKDIEILSFDKNYLKEISKVIGSTYESINEFIIQLNMPELVNDDPDYNPVNLYPLIENDGEVIVYVPTTIPNALMDFVFRKAKQYGCYKEIAMVLQEKQFDNSCSALINMGWSATDIKLPEDTLNLPIREMIFQFDNQKFGYLCFVDTMKEPAKSSNENALEQRNKTVAEYLSRLNSKQNFQILTLFIIAETGIDGFFSWNIPSIGNQTTMFRYGELMTIAFAEDSNHLSLWKFAKTYTRTSEKMRIMSMGGTLDAYAIYNDNNGSLVHSDEANPFGGTMMIANGSSNEFYRSVQKNRDEHAVLAFDGKVVGYTKVIRPKRYAAVFKDKFTWQHRIVIEDYKMPIWVTNYQKEKGKDTSFAKIICEAIAYWMKRMEPLLKPILEPLKFIQLELEVVVNEKLLNDTEFEIKEVDFKSIFITSEISAPRIRMHIPYEFLYLVRNPNNEADKFLVRGALQGVVAYSTEAKKTIELSEERISEIIELTLQPSQAKMILFGDPTRNVRLDTRNLPPMRYLSEADVSFILDNIVSYLPKGYKIPKKIASKDDKIKVCDDVVLALINIIEEKIAKFNGEQLLQWLIRSHEKCVQIREFREILIPARIACYSTVDAEVKELTNKEENLVSTSHSLRTLIEFVACKVPSGDKWPNFDDIDELLALTSQISNWGSASEAMRFDLSDPEMGLLPSGRIGMEKSLEKDTLEPYQNAKMHSEVFQNIEQFEKNYLPKDAHDNSEETDDTKELNKAFEDEFGITLTKLSWIIGVLINEGFRDGKPWVEIEEQELQKLLLTKIENLSESEIQNAIQLLTLIERDKIIKPPLGFKLPDIFPWHYTRPLSYLRKPLIAVMDEEGTKSYYYGFRHLMMYLDNLIFLLYTGKLPERSTVMMNSWIGGILEKKGKPYRDSVRDWFKTETKFEVIDYEVTMKPGGHFEVKEDIGDIDVLVLDHEKKIIYPVECKNSIGARNIHEMKNEMDMYLGREGQEKKSKINKHVERDKWLHANKQAFTKFGIQNPNDYQIKSFILTADEIPLTYLKKEILPLPIRSFIFLRKDGVSILDDL